MLLSEVAIDKELRIILGTLEDELSHLKKAQLWWQKFRLKVRLQQRISKLYLVLTEKI
jgi:hypothetical protein